MNRFRKRGLGTLGVLVVVAATFFGTRWHYSTQAAQMVAEKSAVSDSLGGEIAVRDRQIAEKQERLDTLAEAVAEAVARAEATPLPTRPPEPPVLFSPGEEEIVQPWIDYADSLEGKLTVEIEAREAVEEEVTELRLQNVLLTDQVADWRARYGAEMEVNANLARQLAALQNPSWFKRGKVKYASGVVSGFVIACKLWCG